MNLSQLQQGLEQAFKLHELKSTSARSGTSLLY